MPFVDEVCVRHPDRETGRHCTRCGTPACSDCLKSASVGAHCVDCRKASAPSTSERVRTAVALGTPYVTYALIAVNVLAFLSAAPGSQAQGDLATWAVGIERDGEWYRAITGAFLHGSIMHIGFNMLLLFQLGSMLERLFGVGRFAGLYALSLLGGSIGALLFAPGNTATVGASGAVYGLMGAVAVLMQRRGISVMQSGIGGLIIINVIISFVVPNISIGGHLGGLVTGALAGLLLDPGPRGATTPSGRTPLVAAATVAAIAVLFYGTLLAADIAFDRLLSSLG